MKQSQFEIMENRALTGDVYQMLLWGDTSEITAPGQFVNIQLDGLYLRRPISVYDWDSRCLTILYKVVGKGTALMAGLSKGAALDILTGLGNGYDTAKSGAAPLVIGGGVGVPPLYALTKQLLREEKEPTVILGFNTADEIICEAAFRALGVRVLVTTVDGSYGIPSFVTDAMPQAGEYSYLFACGPMPMLRAVDQAAKAGGQFSFEEHMGCGFGACVGCTCKTKYGHKRICKDGPVLEREEIVW